MLASTSSNTDINHCEHDDSHSFLMLPSTSTDKLKERNKRTTDESDSDSDVFGDFEMANQTATNDSNGICTEEANSSTEAAQNRPLQNSPSSDQKLLEETWKASKTEFDDILQVPPVDAPMANLFSLFSTDGADELTEIDGLTLKSFRLWEQICHLEETRLLQIRWDNSRGSELLMKALSSTRNAFKEAKSPKGKQLETNLNERTQSSCFRSAE
ncbi:hypothetical protein GPALN_012650 [Globodera pallida]|nr:hypothetical protein GPALN_012650 [Globodera pallida]